MKTSDAGHRSMKALIAARRLRSFRSSEDGGIIIFSLFIFVLMLMAAGLAVDLMRFETARAKLQGTLDRAILAAADIDQPLSPPDVVKDYMAKAGMLDFLNGEPEWDQGLNYREVSATATVQMPMLFGGLMNIFTGDPPPNYVPVTPVLSAPASSAAEERVTDVEISLVLDVSSSMLSNSRFTNLKPAAREFVTTVLENNGNDVEGLISVSMVPYSAVVNPSEAVTDQLSLTSEHDYSSCILFPDSAFTSISLDQSVTYQRVSHFDYGASTNNSVSPIQRPWCFPGTENAMIVHSTDETELHTAINNLTPFGNTAIDLGAKWGTILLDPDSDTLVGNVVGNTSAVYGRPLDPADDDVLKVLVLMTDGQNTTEYDLKDTFKNDLSTVWINKSSASQEFGDADLNQFSIQVSGTSTASYRGDDQFYWLDGTYAYGTYNYPRGYSNYQFESGATTTAGHGIDYSATVRHMSWQDVLATWPRSAAYSKLFYQPYQYGYISYSTYVASYYSIESKVNGTLADTRLASLCQTARNNGIVIYTVAFEAPSHGEYTLSNCASSPSHYFDVDGTEISTAFSAIASDIRQLKLTQ